MINRILIRIKVIQILYSFLLVEKQFNLESNPMPPTKEKRFAYSLYLDLLLLMIKVAARVQSRQGVYPLADTRFISRLQICEEIKNLIRKYETEPFPLENLVGPLVKTVEASGVYNRFLKDLGKDPDAAQSGLWKDLFNHVFMTNIDLNKAIGERPQFSYKAVDRMKDMMENTFVNFLSSQDNVAEVEKALAHSLDKARELYFRLLLLPIELTDLEDRILDENRYKFLKTDKDINPDMRFVENRMVDALRHNPDIEAFQASTKFSWFNEDPVLVRSLLKAVKDSEIYKDFMSSPKVVTETEAEEFSDNNNLSEMHADEDLWRHLMKHVILENPDFLEALEEKSVFWNDDLDIVSTFVLKAFRRIADGDEKNAVLAKFKDDEDARFGSELIRYIYRNKDYYRKLIDDVLVGGNWDKDRIAFMDIVVLEAALAEILNFPKIPLSVSVNEYIELAKSYSTSRSGQFIHGVLGKIIDKLQNERVLLKK